MLLALENKENEQRSAKREQQSTSPLIGKLTTYCSYGLHKVKISSCKELTRGSYDCSALMRKARRFVYSFRKCQCFPTNLAGNTYLCNLEAKTDKLGVILLKTYRIRFTFL